MSPLRRPRHRWRSWSGTASADPVRQESPGSVAELAALVADTADRGGMLRPVGAGRSWTPVAACDDVMVRLDALGGSVAIAPDGTSVTCGAGMSLAAIGRRLAEAGLALAGAGADGPTTLGGALATGVHGTGGSVGPLHASVEGIELVDGTGAVRWVAEEDLPAARLGLGALGVMTRVRLAVRRAEGLVRSSVRVALDDALADFGHHVADHRHASFSWVPHTDWARLELADPGDDPSSGPGPGTGAAVAGRAASWTLEQVARTFPEVASTVAGVLGSGAAVLPASPSGRYQAMAFALPATALRPVIGALQVMVADRDLPAVLPVQVRAVPADTTAWLSPAWGRDTVTVTLRTVRGMPYTPLFRAAQEVFLAHGGRPHWGLVHTLGADRLAPAYPRWEDFRAVRARLDPTGVFASPYLTRILGPHPAEPTSVGG